ncbi:MAG: hypothetical protein O7F70_01165 [Gemmatimonadetes bacterium]|nr:hypothetical protein [Gemmatimonadota bacterium]
MTSGLFAVVSLCVALGAFTTPSAAQDTPTTQNGTLRVFLDCFFCRRNLNHFRREIAFVNYVRDRQDADVHILGTRQGAGAGIEYTFAFIGLQEFAGREDTLRYTASSTNTADETRDAQTRMLALGLVPFVANSPVAQRLRILYSPPQGEQRTGVVGGEQDPWNSWVFRISANGGASGESQRRGYSARGAFSADRITEEWKIELEANGSVSRTESDLSDDSTFVDSRRSYELEGRIVRSLGIEHWATGLEAEATSSTFSNQDFRGRVAGGIEYSVFPFSESTRRQLTLLYSIGVSRFNYEEITIFGRTEETRADQRLNVAYTVRQPWGSANTSLTASNFLHDFSLHRVRISGRLDFRIVRGLSLNASGSFSRIKDQISLPGAGIPPEEILLRRRALGTAFEYRASFGLSYRWGSIFNNVVNPRRGV